MSLALAAVLLAGCEPGSRTGPDRSTSRFEATVTGAAATTIKGRAIFGVAADAATGRARWTLQLQSEQQDPYTLIVFELDGGQSPPTGVYSVSREPGPGRFTAQYLEQRSGTPTGRLAATAGTLTILESSAKRVEGSIQFTARGYLVVGNTAANDAELQVRGTFLAVPGH